MKDFIAIDTLSSVLKQVTHLHIQNCMHLFSYAVHLLALSLAAILLPTCAPHAFTRSAILSSVRALFTCLNINLTLGVGRGAVTGIGVWAGYIGDLTINWAASMSMVSS